MSRAAIYDAILADPRISNAPTAPTPGLGIGPEDFLVNYDGEQRPNDKTFLVMAWSNEEIGMRGDDTQQRRFKNITIWAHIYRELSTDFNRLDDILNILDDILLNMIHVAGSDGETVTLVESNGRSRDMRDDAYQTICRSISYRILSRETATV